MKTLIPVERIENKILLIRDQKVMLDTNLAELYGVETRVLVQAVKRNLNRFPADFLFRLTPEEFAAFEITNCDLKRGPRRETIPPLRFHRAWCHHGSFGAEHATRH